MRVSSLFATSTRSLRGTGVAAEFGSVDAAAEVVADGMTVTGAFGFDPSGPAAFVAPEQFGRAPWPRAAAASFGDAERRVTEASVHAARVRKVLAAIDRGVVDKAVVARTLEAVFHEPIDPTALAARFVPGADATTTTAFAVPLDAAGRRGHWLTGASPELLVRRSGRVVTCHPFAGSAPRLADPEADRASRESLRASDKDLREHAFVVDSMVSVLAPLCAELDVPDGPQIESTPAVWHLATPIRGVLDDAAVTALDLAARLSPTPAVCGTPTAAAASLIAEVEGPRGFYAGGVGWCEGNGDGQWMVSIRCLELDAAGTGVTTWAGGGIVAGSDPDLEVAETDAKFRTVLGALGLS